MEVWEFGRPISTQYDKPDDPPSRDAAVMLTINNPMQEPRIHRCFPAGFNDLEKYRAEVLYGAHDHWVGEGTKWKYTYHDRITRTGGIDQLEIIVDLLKDCPHTRRAQVITWNVQTDLGSEDPPCLQRLWFRVVEGRLDMHGHIRSNDAFKAGFMNMYALIELQAMVAERLGVPVGVYRHFADSYHIYGSYFNEFEGFLKTVKTRSFHDRTITTDECREFFLEGCTELLCEELPDKVREQIDYRKRKLIANCRS